MIRRARCWWVLALPILAWAPAREAPAQGLAPTPTAAGPVAPTWGTIIGVTPSWLVVENDRKQQFPIALDGQHVRLFVVRWPVLPQDLAGPGAVLVEASGRDLGNHRVMTDHVDVYKGPSLQLVSPIYVTPALMSMNNNFQIQTELEFNLFQPLMGVGTGPYMPNVQPTWMHVVGPPVGVNPLLLGIGGNNAVAVVPAPAGLSMTLVTLGSPSMVEPGDLAYYRPTDMGPKSLEVDTLIVVKTIPFSQYVPPAR